MKVRLKVLALLLSFFIFPCKAMKIEIAEGFHHSVPTLKIHYVFYENKLSSIPPWSVLVEKTEKTNFSPRVLRSFNRDIKKSLRKKIDSTPQIFFLSINALIKTGESDIHTRADFIKTFSDKERGNQQSLRHFLHESTLKIDEGGELELIYKEKPLEKDYGFRRIKESEPDPTRSQLLTDLYRQTNPRLERMMEDD